jgi:hypothetical protein
MDDEAITKPVPRCCIHKRLPLMDLWNLAHALRCQTGRRCGILLPPVLPGGLALNPKQYFALT